MPRRRDVLALVLIVLPWTLLISVWHQSPVTPQPVTRKDERRVLSKSHSDGLQFKESCVIYNGVSAGVFRRASAYGRPPPWSGLLPTIHIITPTYTRPVQKAELTRLANTLLHVPNLHWIVVEDGPRRTPLVSRLLRSTGLNHTHLNEETPRSYRLHREPRGGRVPRGTVQRNLGLRWLREALGHGGNHRGVVYFADDDNTYSLELFEEF
ncbi:hypothetical protein NFI96_008797 [Prochilodus magdalenae]|nr:hypothetical protein NFI96_008797 [Prochilodus magdalenae]